MDRSFTSLRHVIEKLLEAEYFLARTVSVNGLEFQFELNAFLSASRSVTFVLQKSMSKVPNFDSWYSIKQAQMRSDASMRFFIDLRNISQKQGPVSYVGGTLLNGCWAYRFVGRPDPVPSDLVGIDIRICCAKHLTKLGLVIKEFYVDFPFFSCPERALSEEGMAAIGYDWRDIELALGLPEGYTKFPDIPASERLRVLAREVEPLDIEALNRISAGNFLSMGERLSLASFEGNGTDLTDDLATLMSSPEAANSDPREIFLKSIFNRI